jgi:hypothetical protein
MPTHGAVRHLASLDRFFSIRGRLRQRREFFKRLPLPHIKPLFDARRYLLPEFRRRLHLCNLTRSHLKNTFKVLYFEGLRSTFSSVHAEVNPCHDVKRSMTSNGKSSHRYSVSRFREQTVVDVHARTIAKFSTAFCGYCDRAQRGRIYRSGSSRTKRAIDDSSIGCRRER